MSIVFHDGRAYTVKTGDDFNTACEFTPTFPSLNILPRNDLIVLCHRAGIACSRLDKRGLVETILSCWGAIVRKGEKEVKEEKEKNNKNEVPSSYEAGVYFYFIRFYCVLIFIILRFCVFEAVKRAKVILSEKVREELEMDEEMDGCTEDEMNAIDELSRLKKYEVEVQSWGKDKDKVKGKGRGRGRGRRGCGAGSASQGPL